MPIGSGRVARDGTDVLIATWANGLYMSLRVAERLRLEGVSCRVLDLRWLVPLPVDDLLANATDVGRVVVVDETRHQGGVGESSRRRPRRGRRSPGRSPASPPRDSFVPLGDAANLVLVSEDDIADAVRAIRALKFFGAGRRPAASSSSGKAPPFRSKGTKSAGGKQRSFDEHPLGLLIGALERQRDDHDGSVDAHAGPGE